MNEQPSQRPWPAPSPDAGWWRGEAAGIPPAPKPAPPNGSEPDPGLVARMEAPSPRPDDTETFPLWPTTTTVMVATPPPPEDLDLDPDLEVDPEAHQAGVAAVRNHLANREDQWPPPAMRAMRQPRDSTRTSPQHNRRPGKSRRPRGAATGLVSMLLVALLTGFFAWTSAEPFWLDMGHAVRGTAEITSCKGSGVLQRCLTSFTPSGGTEAVGGVPLVGLEEAPGTVVDARMVPDGRIAYAGNPSGLRVRWTVGLALVLLCGCALSWLTGAWRVGARLRTRLAAWSLTTAAPLVLSAGILASCY